MPKEAWSLVLVGMAPYLGFTGAEFPEWESVEPIESSAPGKAEWMAYGKNGVEEKIDAYKIFLMPTKLISDEDWLLIRDYFLENALTREEMTLPERKVPLLKGFTPTIPDLDIEPNGLVITTLVDEKNQILYVGRSSGRATNPVQASEELHVPENLVAFDLKTGKRVGYKELGAMPVGLEITDTGFRLSEHRSPIRPAPGQPPVPSGTISDWTGFDTQNPRARMLVNGLYLTTEHHTQDLNGDGLDDIVATMFGDNDEYGGGGRFSVFWQTPEFAEIWEDAPAEIPFGTLEGALEETVLLERAGPISSAIADFNNDGKPDIALLTAQVLQEVILHINQGDGKFTQEKVLEHGVTFGGNSIYASDMDGDGHTDIVVVNGDFGTDGPRRRLGDEGFTEPKPYHGVRVFRNSGDLTFTERYFYPIHGALKAALADFDDDGDTDIAVVAPYVRWDWEKPESFVYLENKGGLEFAPMSLPREYWGVWTIVEAADVNGDEKPDIVLGLQNWARFVPENWMNKLDIMKGRNGEAATITFLINDH